MCQLEWAVRCPDIWSNVTLCFCEVFLDEVGVSASIPSKTDMFSPMCVNLVQLVEDFFFFKFFFF